jgi:hypothetical protein
MKIIGKIKLIIRKRKKTIRREKADENRGEAETGLRKQFSRKVLFSQVGKF